MLILMLVLMLMVVVMVVVVMMMMLMMMMKRLGYVREAGGIRFGGTFLRAEYFNTTPLYI